MIFNVYNSILLCFCIFEPLPENTYAEFLSFPPGNVNPMRLSRSLHPLRCTAGLPRWKVRGKPGLTWLGIRKKDLYSQTRQVANDNWAVGQPLVFEHRQRLPAR